MKNVAKNSPNERTTILSDKIAKFQIKLEQIASNIFTIDYSRKVHFKLLKIPV